MINFNLITYKVEDMNEMQMKEINGGFAHFLIAAFVGGFIYEVAMNSSDAGGAVMEGYRSRR